MRISVKRSASMQEQQFHVYPRRGHCCVGEVGTNLLTNSLQIFEGLMQVKRLFSTPCNWTTFSVPSTFCGRVRGCSNRDVNAMVPATAELIMFTRHMLSGRETILSMKLKLWIETNTTAVYHTFGRQCRARTERCAGIGFFSRVTNIPSHFTQNTILV